MLLAYRPIRHIMPYMEFSAPGIESAIQNRTNRAVDQPPGLERIRLVLLDTHVLFRESLARLLASEHDLELVAECTTPAEALKSLGGSRVDVVLVDIGIATEFIPCARKARYTGKSLVIARETDVTGSAVVLKSGASGIFLDSDSSARLVQAIRLVANGEAWVDQKVIQFLAERYPPYEDRWSGTLTEREQTVLQGVIDGLSNRKIGVKMGVSESTIKASLQRLFTKSGVRTRSQLVRISMEALPPPVPQSKREIGPG
jgi:DNA-binding NarL/FixJ family response regulator